MADTSLTKAEIVAMLRSMAGVCRAADQWDQEDDVALGKVIDRITPDEPPARTKQRGFIRSFEVQTVVGTPVLITISFECDEDEARALGLLAQTAFRVNRPVTLELQYEPSREHAVFSDGGEVFRAQIHEVTAALVADSPTFAKWCEGFLRPDLMEGKSVAVKLLPENRERSG